MNIVQQSLSAKEVDRLQQVEAIIERGKAAFVQVGLALAEIRDGRLYRDDYGTFEMYCQKRWGFERRYAYRLIDAAEVVENVSRGTQKPVNERQARSLAKLKPEHQPKAWKAAVDKAESEDRPVTACDVEAEVTKINGNSHAGRAAWELNKTPEPKETHDEDRDSENLSGLKRYWRRAGKRDRARFLKWIKK